SVGGGRPSRKPGFRHLPLVCRHAAPFWLQSEPGSGSGIVGEAMKLIFPQGEHAPYDLAEGVVRIGSAVDCDLRIEGTGVAAHHCEIETREGSATVRAVDPAAATVFNGRQITEPTELAPGDLLLFGRVGCRIGTAAPQPPPASEADAQEEMNGHT